MKFYIVLLLLLSIKAHAQSVRNSFEEIRDIAYLPPEEIQIDSLQRLNLIIPADVQNPPLFVWIGGGAWSFVSRDIEMALARQFAGNGIAVASIGHRLSKGAFRTSSRKDGVIHPAHIEDVAAAFNYLYHNAGEYGYDPKSIIVGGFSSGAHLAALLAMDKRYLAIYDLKPDQIKAIIPVGGTYDIDHYYLQFKDNPNPQTQRMASTHVKDVFGEDVSEFAEASPATYLENMQIPMLLISDNALKLYTDEFEKRLKESKYEEYQIHHVKELNHQELWLDLSNNPNSETAQLMIDFIKKQ